MDMCVKLWTSAWNQGYYCIEVRSKTGSVLFSFPFKKGCHRDQLLKHIAKKTDLSTFVAWIGYSYDKSGYIYDIFRIYLWKIQDIVSIHLECNCCAFISSVTVRYWPRALMTVSPAFGARTVSSNKRSFRPLVANWSSLPSPHLGQPWLPSQLCCDGVQNVGHVKSIQKTQVRRITVFSSNHLRSLLR